jgi:stress response protein YsnF
MADRDGKKKGIGAGTAVGAAAGGVAGGAAAGAAAGGLTGPVGAVLGAAVGAVVGAVTGRAAAGPADHDSAELTATNGSGLSTGDDSVHTVIGAFDEPTVAQRAVDRLVQNGFDPGDIHVQHRQGVGTAGAESDGFFNHLLSANGPQGRSLQQDPYARHAHTYDEAVRRGSAVVVVDALGEQRAEEASALLHELGAVDVDERSRQWQAEGWQPPAGTQQTAALAQQDTQQDTQRVEQGAKFDVVEEQLQVGKRTLDRGGVRVIQRVSQRPVREIVRLREEHATIERVSVDRQAGAEELSNFREGTLEVRETVEEPVIAKTARVVEEVRVGKEVREREEIINDTVRRKDVEIERLPGAARERAVAADDMQGLRRSGGNDKPNL